MNCFLSCSPVNYGWPYIYILLSVLQAQFGELRSALLKFYTLFRTLFSGCRVVYSSVNIPFPTPTRVVLCFILIFTTGYSVQSRIQNVPFLIVRNTFVNHKTETGSQGYEITEAITVTLRLQKLKFSLCVCVCVFVCVCVYIYIFNSKDTQKKD